MTRMVALALGMTLLVAAGCRALPAPSQQVAQLDPSENPSRADDGTEALPQGENQANPAPEEIDPPKKPVEATPEQNLQALVDELDPEAAVEKLDTLELPHLLESVRASYPAVLAALQEEAIAQGKQLSARGAFDLKFAAESMNMPMGFYENYRHGVKLEQATVMGGTVYGQYRIGDGSFQPWYGERETNEGGEFKAGTMLPLLRNRNLDERRAEIMKADLQRAAIDPLVQGEMLAAMQVASGVYWSWVAAGQAYMVTRDLLNVAKDRSAAIGRQVELGNLPMTELQQNERLIASREAKLIEMERKLQATAIKLSLFLRDAAGRPIVPSPAALPSRFPALEAPDPSVLDAKIDLALQQRPELRQISLERQSVNVDLRQGQNDLLPNLNAVVEASKDVGGATSSKGDKTPFELEAGLLFDVPLQRSKARGKIQAAQGKLTQLSLKQQFASNKIVAEVQDAASAMRAAYERVERTRESVALAKKLVAAEYRSFELGNSDVLRIAIQEAAELDAQLLEIEAIMDFFQAEADFRAAVGNLPNL